MASRSVKAQIDRAYLRLMQQHGMYGSDARRAVDYVHRGFTSKAAVAMVKAKGNTTAALAEMGVTS